jgi:hypothetical protein
MVKWEYMVLESHAGYVNEHLERLYSERWEVAGNADVKYHDSPTNSAFIYIPLRRIKDGVDQIPDQSKKG